MKRTHLVLGVGLLLSACSDPVCEGSDVSQCDPDDCTYVEDECLLRCADLDGVILDCPSGTTCSRIPISTPDDDTRVCLE